jgi:hypothetical protein
MSIMFLKIRSVSRGQGGSAVAKAAYISRSRIVDASDGRIHDYRRTPGLLYSEILTHPGAQGADWARDRSTLWNRAEAVERNWNARVAREYTVALPHELGADARILLARGFAQSLADRYRTAVDLAVHAPTRTGDPRNYHAHILATTREIRDDGFYAKTAIERSSANRRALGMQHVAYEFRELRAEWAALANERLQEASVEARIEPRSRATIAREAALSAATADAASALRATPVAAAAQPAAPPSPASPAAGASAARPSLGQQQERAVAEWLAYRRNQAGHEARPPERHRESDRARDAGFEL